MFGLNLVLYSHKEKNSVYRTPYTYFSDGASILDTLIEFSKEENNKDFKNKLEARLPSSECNDIEELLSLYVRTFHDEACNVSLNYLSTKNIYLSHWISLLNERYQELEDSYNYDLKRFFVIPKEETKYFLNDLKESIDIMKPTEKVNLGFQEFLDYCNENIKDHNDYSILIEGESAFSAMPNYMKVKGLISIKKLLLDKDFHSYVEEYDDEDIFEDTSSDDLLDSFIRDHYNSFDIVINYLIDKDTKNIMKFSDILSYVKYPKEATTL